MRRATARWDATTAMMVAGDDDNDVDEDSVMGNEVDDDGKIGPILAHGFLFTSP